MRKTASYLGVFSEAVLQIAVVFHVHGNHAAWLLAAVSVRTGLKHGT
jgi:hypothetical protein